MKIVITHTDLRLYWPARIAALQKLLLTRGDELHVVEIAGSGSPYSFSTRETPEPKGVRNWDCLFPDAEMEEISPALASATLQTRLDQLAPDLVMAGSIAFPSGATAVRWAKQNNRPVIMFDDARPQDVIRNPLVNYIKQLIYRQVDAILCPAAPWVEAYARWEFRPEQIFFGVDVVDNDFWAQRASTGPIPGLPSGYWLVVGRQIPAKNLLFLLKAYAAYRDLIPPALSLPLVIVGEGPERSAMETYIKEHRLPRVTLLPFVNQETLRMIYHHAAALILPSRSETWGLVVNEAMAAGLPVLVSTRCGAAGVLVEDKINGYTFSPDDPLELTHALLAFTNLGSRQKAAMGLASKRLISPWGLAQFAHGSHQAIQYAMTHNKRCRSAHTRFILRQWKGRYRPV